MRVTRERVKAGAGQKIKAKRGGGSRKTVERQVRTQLKRRQTK